MTSSNRTIALYGLFLLIVTIGALWSLERRQQRLAHEADWFYGERVAIAADLERTLLSRSTAHHCPLEWGL